MTFDHPDVVLCPDGPMLLRGDHVVEDADGVAHRTTRPVIGGVPLRQVVASPWCDGTHKVLPRRPAA